VANLKPKPNLLPSSINHIAKAIGLKYLYKKEIGKCLILLSE
jgi:hypothetical protein